MRPKKRRPQEGQTPRAVRERTQEVRYLYCKRISSFNRKALDAPVPSDSLGPRHVSHCITLPGATLCNHHGLLMLTPEGRSPGRVGARTLLL